MSHQIVLVGNGTNANRGCEAIARGTLEVFRQVAGDDVTITSGIIVHSDEVARTLLTSGEEGQPAQFAIRFRPDTSVRARLKRKLLGKRVYQQFPEIDPQLDGATHILEVGGDNYSLDYGKPYTFIDLDTQVRKSGAPLAIWGASIGPFSADPEFEAEMIAHLSTLDHIFVRESVSLSYLTQHGLTNVTLMADPAVLMPPQAPPDPTWDVETFKGAIGLNMSPFQARHLSHSGHVYWKIDSGELDALAEFGAQVVGWLLNNDDRSVILIPHVMAKEAWNNDHMLLSEVYRRLSNPQKARVALLPTSLNAPQVKWVLGQCSIFAGSRTHSTLGAISSGVPTLAFGYSRKAIGLMRDLYGHDEMCLSGESFDLENVISSLRRLIECEPALRQSIADALPRWRESTLQAGRLMLNLK